MREESPSYEFTVGENGLYDAYYNVYYPYETDTVLINKYKAELKKSRDERGSKGDVIYIDRYDDFNLRKKIPERSRVYYIRYEYFLS